jgi:DNA-binding transcriptional regulator YhcF (GntR family)
MQIRLDPASPIPPFEQVRGQLSLQVASGRLLPGQRLPTIRQLATDLGLAKGTVARAYRELELSGIVEAQGRAGTFVAAEPPVAYSVLERRQRLREAAERYAGEVMQINVDLLTALDAAELALVERSELPA